MTIMETNKKSLRLRSPTSECNSIPPFESCSPSERPSSKPTAPSVNTSTCSDNQNSENKRIKRAKTMPSVSIYRPPAARRLEQNANLAPLHTIHHHHNQQEHHGREEVVQRPATPEKTGLKCSEESKDVSIGTPVTRKNYENGISVFRNAISSIRTQNKVPTATKNAENGNSTNKKSESVLPTAHKVDEGGKSKQRRPDIQVYVPKGRRSAPAAVPVINATNGNLSNNNSVVFSNTTSDDYKNDVNLTAKPAKKPQQTEKERDEKEKSVPGGQHPQNAATPAALVPDTLQVIDKDTQQVSEVTRDKSSAEKEATVPKSSAPVTADSGDWTKSPEVPDPVQCLKNSPSTNSSQSGAESPKRKANGAVKTEKKTPVVGKKVESTEPVKTVSGDGKPKEVHLNPEEDDWESMFDDTGECLDPSLLDQLTAAVGHVTIETPKSAFNDFKTKSFDVMGDEFPHVIEIYNFPPEFQLQDLMTVFSQFKNSGFEIKWVDETHALGIFSSSAVVSEVLSFYHPFVKTRSLKEGTPLSKMKARRSADTLLPYKTRPDTCPALARRLVTGALGVKLKTSREEREAEKKILTKARERKKLEAKQKEDAWEGTFS